jgi:hypothetical protein
LVAGAAVAICLALPGNAGAVVEQFPFFDGNGAPFTFTVPFDVTHITIDAVGAKGGGPSGGVGALGGEAIGSFVFASGDPLQFDIGGDGGGCATPAAPNGGFFGGGSGGSGCAGGGGGETDVRTGACAATPNCGTSNAIIVAGGGGGNATDDDEGQGGSGGQTGENATAGHNGVVGGSGGGGQGGTQTAGGAGGVGGTGSFFPNPSPAGGDGTAFQGGVGGHDGCSGGGGGAGFFGGGGGGSASGGNGCGGGGGGSSFVATSGTNASFHPGVAGTLGGGQITLTFLYDTQTTSQPSAAVVSANTPVSDTITVNGNHMDTPTGAMSFAICGPLTGATGCAAGSGNTVGTSVALTANNDTNETASATSSTSVSETTPGYYCFSASYPGDVNYNPSADTGSDGCFIVRGPSSTGATASLTTLQLGGTVEDTATVTGAGIPPTGNVAFSVCGPLSNPAPCTSGGTSDGTAALGPSGGSQVATARQFTPTALGVWCFRADYQGDPVYLTSSGSGTATNCFTVTPANSTTISTPATPSIQLGDTTHDSVTISGNPVAGTPVGTVNFEVCGPLPSASECASGGTSLGSATLSGGTANSPDFVPAALGTYCYRADYTGQGNYLSSSDSTVRECFAVHKADSATNSTPADSTIQIGATTSDSATVTGNPTGGTPTGSVSFSVCGPLASSSGCGAGAGTALGTSTLNGGSADSLSFTPTAVGTYCYLASYGGDANYLASADGAASECFTVTAADSTTISMPADNSIQLGAATHDSAAVTGNVIGGTPTGAVNFSVCGPLASASGCASGGTSLGGATLSGGTATGPSFTPGVLGTYCFRADYVGGGNYLASSDGSAGECFTVTQADSATISTPDDPSIQLAGSTSDSVTVTGNATGGTPTGSVSFSVCGPLSSASGCGSGGASLGTASLSGGGATSPSFTPTALGTYCFRADYSGDTNYLASSDGSATECFTVTPADSSTTSTPADGSIRLGAATSDAVTVTGNSTGGTPAGTVNFSVCGPLDSASGCVTGGSSIGSATLSGGSADSPSFTPTALGTYCYRADYVGSGNYLGSSDASTTECFTVTQAQSTTTSTPADSSILLGNSTTDGVVVSGNAVAGTPTGTVNFSVCGPLASASGCASGGTSLGGATLNGGTATGPSFTPSALGTYCFRADYAGAGNYLGSSDGSASECFMVSEADSATISTPGDSSIQLAGSTADSVTVTGNATGGSPTGSVSFSVCGPLSSASGCASGGTSLGTASLSGGSATSPSFTPTALGTYCFRADYSGDTNYLASSDGSATECFTVTPADSATASTPADGSIRLGAATSDAVTVTGNSTGGTPAGTVNFSVCGPLDSASGCATGGSSIGSATLSGGAAGSPSFTPSALGTYCYRADYVGSGNYLGSSDASTTECFTVTQAQSTTASTPADSSVELGDSTSDGVVVSGNPVAGTPTGNVSFAVCGPLASASGCASGGTSLGGATLNGGTATGPSFTAGALGTYCFRADYAGAGNYVGSSDGSASECFTVIRAHSTASSKPAKAMINLGGSDTDTVTLSGNQAIGVPSGSVSFFVCGPLTSAAGCQSGGTPDGSADLGPDASANSAPFTPHVVGTFCFRADYGGDSNFLASSDSSSSECFSVAKGDAQLSVTAGEATTTMAAGDTGHAVVTAVAGGPRPTGSVTFFVCGPLPGPSPCGAGAGTRVGSGAVSLTPRSGSTAVATSPVFKPTRPGTWCLRVEYSGDGSYNASADGSSTDCFTVAQAPPPSVQISAPVNGRRYAFGAVVRAHFGCQESSSGPGLASCDGTVANDSLLATKTPGTHQLTVTARSLDGETSSQTATYTVLPDNHLTIPARHSHKLHGGVKGAINGTISLHVRVPGPGVIDVLVTAWKNNLATGARLAQPAPHRFVYGRKHAVARHRGKVHLVIHPNRKGRLLLAHHRYRITLRVWVAFTPHNGTRRSTGIFGLHLGP